MSATDFLFNGSPPNNLTTTTSDTSSLPAWYQSYLQGLMGTANTIAAQPYPAYTGPRLADFNAAQNTAFTQAGNIGQAGAANMASANGALTSAANQNIPGAVQPYLNSSVAQATPGGIQSYMSPYLNNQVQGIENLANQNWNNTIMPSVNNSFIGAGQYGSGRNLTVLGQQANQWGQGVDAAVANADQAAYSTAGQQAATQAGIQQTAGNMAGSAQQQQGALDTAIGSAQGALGQQAQNMALQQASANQAVGNQQQAQTQSNLDLSYQDFQNQANWPKTQASFMSDIIRGLQTPGTTTTGSSSAPPTTFNQAGGPSIANTGLAAAGSAPLFARGGRVSHLAPGGMPMQPSAPMQPPGGGANPFAGYPQDRASKTPDGGVYIPRPVANKIAMMLAQKGQMTGANSAQQPPGGAPPSGGSPVGALSMLGAQ
jgi:hypothetical protein